MPTRIDPNANQNENFCKATIPLAYHIPNVLSLALMGDANDTKSEPNGLVAIGEVLKKLVDQPTLKSGPFREIHIWEEWSKVVGPKIARQTQLQTFEQGRLYVGANHPTWVTELNFRREELREKLNAALGRQAVREIVFRLDHRPSR